MNVDEIILNDQYKSIIPRPNAEEFQALKEDINKQGIKETLKINTKNILLDGYTRYEIAKELQIWEVPVEIKNFKKDEDEWKYIISLNLHRRHLNNAQKAVIGLMQLEIEKEKATSRMLAGKNNPMQNSDQGTAMEIAAKKVGISHDTLNRAKKIIEIAQKHPHVMSLWDGALKGETSINNVYEHAKMVSENEDYSKLLLVFSEMPRRPIFKDHSEIQLDDKDKIILTPIGIHFPDDLTQDEFVKLGEFVILFSKITFPKIHFSDSKADSKEKHKMQNGLNGMERFIENWKKIHSEKLESQPENTTNA